MDRHIRAMEHIASHVCNVTETVKRVNTYLRKSPSGRQTVVFANDYHLWCVKHHASNIKHQTSNITHQMAHGATHLAPHTQLRTIIICNDPRHDIGIGAPHMAVCKTCRWGAKFSTPKIRRNTFSYARGILKSNRDTAVRERPAACGLPCVG